MKDFPQLDSIIHEPTRLKIMSALMGLDPEGKVDFTFLRDLLKLTDGNLSVHLRKLEENGYVSIEKTFVRRRPKTWISLTEEGRKAFKVYVEALERILKQSR
ncbi:MAG: transcriptional regulator [Candidatus Aminicenantes bacterium]|nr:transcriptional regulator [Candidatus Aminicenantes bacterium]